MSEANTLKGIQGGQREPRVTTELASYNKTNRHDTISTYWSARVTVDVVCARVLEKILPKGWRFSLTPLHICFIALSERRRNTL